MKVIALALLMLSQCWALENDRCSATASTSDVRFTLALKDHSAVFQQGEIIPLELTFTSSTKNRYWADVRNYDRSGRLETEYYCVEPEVRDPLESYFKGGTFLGGGLGGTRALDSTPFTATAELNEWRSPGPGRYRVYAISYRVWRPPDSDEKTPYGRISEVVRSNAVEFEVKPVNAKWQEEQMQGAAKAFVGTSTGDEVRRAARTLRFLNTKKSTRLMTKLFWGLNQDQSEGWDLMFGLYGSPYRELAIDSMQQEISAHDHPITAEFLHALVGLEISADHAWDPPAFSESQAKEAQAYWTRRQAHIRELTKAEIQTVLAALSNKAGKARAVTLNGLLMAAADDEELAQTVRPGLIAAWKDLPKETQQDLIQYRWPLIASRDMLLILKQVVAAPPPPTRTMDAMTRDASLKHIYELDPAEGRTLILRDIQNAQPSLDVIKLLTPEDIAVALQPALERIAENKARDLDYELIDRYGESSALPLMQRTFEAGLGGWACAPQSAMLRYFLRVDSEYGAQQVKAALRQRKRTHCYSMVLQSLGEQLPKVQQIAIEALDDSDPDLVQDAVIALGPWGTAEAESALWARLKRFHEQWAGREGELRSTPDYRSPGARAVALEQGLVSAIGRGVGWICPPEKQARLAALILTEGEREQIEGWRKEWKEPEWQIRTDGLPDNRPPTFSFLQYGPLTEEQFRIKLGQLPRGSRLVWQFWKPGQISPPVSIEKQEALYQRIRVVAEEHGLVLVRSPQE